MRALFAILCLFAANANADVINWVDTAVYPKPPPVHVNKPDEATVTNKYWVVLSGGSGTACTPTDPCTMDGPINKPGTQGGPAIIYVKGTGSMSWFQDTIFGSGDVDCRTNACPNWILIRPWPAGSPGCTVECTATFTGNSNMNSSNVHHIMWDGGPDLKIRFNSNSAGNYGHNINSDWHVVYRTQMFCSGSNNSVLGWQVGSTTVADHVYFINNEFHTCRNTNNQASAIYWGPGSTGGYTDAIIQNNIIRNWGGEGIEVNPRVTSNGMQIIGNVLYDNGQVTCNTSWRCRPHIVVDVFSGGGNHNTYIANNVMWNSWSGCIWDRGGGTPRAIIVNNTCYNYSMYGAEDDNNPNPAGITDGNGSTVRNNIFLAAPGSGSPPLEGTYTASNNACEISQTCGSNKQNWSASQWLSTSPTTLDFLTIGSSSVARDNGTNTNCPSKDFDGKNRPRGSVCDIGAFEFGTGDPATRPNPPTLQ